METMYRSPRGHLLAYFDATATMPVIAIELYLKWYELFVIMPDGTVEPFQFVRLDELSGKMGMSPYVDHTPNPLVIARWAVENDYFVSELSMELIIGRWEREGKNNYESTF